jgi:hypothetical protein
MAGMLVETLTSVGVWDFVPAFVKGHVPLLIAVLIAPAAAVVLALVRRILPPRREGSVSV